MEQCFKAARLILKMDFCNFNVVFLSKQTKGQKQKPPDITETGSKTLSLFR